MHVFKRKYSQLEILIGAAFFRCRFIVIPRIQTEIQR